MTTRAPRWAAAGVTVLAVVLAGASAAAGPFGWFKAGPSPAGWRQATLPAGAGVLAYPGSFRLAAGDPGTVTAELHDGSGAVTGYLNATPRQGNETLRNWPEFRIDHQGDEEQAIHEEARAFDLRFRGGTGSCVVDRYVTPLKSNSYREIACYVVGAHGGSVLVAAAPPALWSGSVGEELERAVSAYEAR